MRGLVMRVIALVLGVALALVGAAFQLYESGAKRGQAQAELERVHLELKAMTSSRDVEYWSRECDREKREELARCGCTCLESPR